MSVVRFIIGYVRVSTQGQGQSGLGIEAQEQALAAYARMTGAVILRTYVEVESGRRNDRPQLALALAHAKRSKATLCVAKLDRLSRNVSFLASVMDSGADFVAVDNPAANRLTLHVLAAVAEQEAKAISDRTKAALAALKARGVALGAARPEGFRFTAEHQRKGAVAAGQAITRQAKEAYADLGPRMVEWRSQGKTQAEIAGLLNAEGHTTRRGKPWNQVQVLRVLQRFGG